MWWYQSKNKWVCLGNSTDGLNGMEQMEEAYLGQGWHLDSK